MCYFSCRVRVICTLPHEVLVTCNNIYSQLLFLIFFNNREARLLSLAHSRLVAMKASIGDTTDWVLQVIGHTPQVGHIC